ncbi:unnamed protein product [Calypogeia fissa]
MDFFSTYKLYKQATSQVVAWLGKTAAHCGYKLSSADTSKLENKSNILKQQDIQANISRRRRQRRQHLRAMVMPRVNRRARPQIIRFRFESSLSWLGSFRSTSNKCRMSRMPDILEVLKDAIVKRKQCAKACLGDQRQAL